MPLNNGYALNQCEGDVLYNDLYKFQQFSLVSVLSLIVDYEQVYRVDDTCGYPVTGAPTVYSGSSHRGLTSLIFSSVR